MFLVSMAKLNTQDLQQTVERQLKTITKYEAKLRDVVSAYKSLQAEKNALEETVKSFTSSTTDTNTTKINEKKNEPQFTDPLRSTTNVESPENTIEHWKEKLGAVTKALATISEEKSKMEANFQADKKKMNNEKDEMKKRVEGIEKKLKMKNNQLSNEIENYKQRLRNLQLEREKDQNDHQIMLRELQEIVSGERSQKEQLEIQLEEAQIMIAVKESQTDRSKQYEKKISSLLDELKEMKAKLKRIEEIGAKPSPVEIKLQYEMAKSEGEHRLAILQEQQRTREVEERLRHESKMSAEQISDLETRLADLSEMIGNYDRHRQQDIITVERLKDKNSQLEVENEALAKAATCIKENDDSNLDTQELKTKIHKLKEILKKTDPKTSSLEIDDSNRIDHSYCQMKYEQLKDELERAKNTNQPQTKAKDKENESEILRHQVTDLKEKINNLSTDLEDVENRDQLTINSLRSSIEELNVNHKQQISTLKSEWQNKVASLEQQLLRQRERSFTLLEEKEKEMELLKVQLGIGQRLANKQETAESKSSYLTDANLLGVAVELCKLTTSDKKEAQFLHYAQELARKDVEITNLRKSKRQLETLMRELDLKWTSKEENYEKLLEDRKNEILRLQRNCSREGANLEYLKNVVLSYMLSSSGSSRTHMLNAIATVLKFSTKELDSVKMYNSTWWWKQTT